MNNKLTSLLDVSIGKGEYGIGAPAVNKSNVLPTYLRITDINDDGTINFSGLKSVDADGYKKYLLEYGDVVFARTGNSTGRSYVYRPKDGNFVYAGFLIKFKLNISKVIPEYFRYTLLSSQYKNWIKGNVTGSTRSNINVEGFGKFTFKLPEISEQKRIADILTALDDKIELNNQMNQTLEEIASLLYKRWFVDFEFPDDKGKPYKSSGGEMVDSELGMIPKRWEVKELGEICVNSDSKRKPLSKNQRERLSGDYPYYGATSIIDYVNDYIFDGTYLLVGEDGTVVTKDGKPILQYITGKIWVNNHAHVLQGKDVSTGFLFCKLSQFDVTHLVTGAVQMKITQSNLNKIKFVISESNIQKRFEKIITLLFNKRNENKIYNEALKKIKKELVIKLI